MPTSSVWGVGNGAFLFSSLVLTLSRLQTEVSWDPISDLERMSVIPLRQS